VGGTSTAANDEQADPDGARTLATQLTQGLEKWNRPKAMIGNNLAMPKAVW
jgi:hypothetical protein